MAKRLTHAQRAERWYNKQVRSGNLRSADYSQLTKRMAICYEPAVLIEQQQQLTPHDMLTKLKVIDNALKIKL